jgi:hypothetical protein
MLEIKPSGRREEFVFGKCYALSVPQKSMCWDFNSSVQKYWEVGPGGRGWVKEMPSRMVSAFLV